MPESTSAHSNSPVQSMPDDAPDRYSPAAIEAPRFRRWLAADLFHAEADDARPAYSIAIPPPNVTGALHMGHALNASIQDALIRHHRMRGYNALWMPGVDHAGIATQNVVEKELRKEGRSRHDLGREKFLEKVWEWKEQYGSTIIGQYHSMGCALDYERERFTMDEGYARAVQHTFVEMYRRGHIYRDNYLVNWCGRCHTAISDLEVRQADADDEMVHVDYPLSDGGGHITVATVRPETIPADVAVAVHPDDERYAALIGRTVRVPFTERDVPVIADAYVDPEFGTGALKITPGHDPNDFEIGNRHGLERLSAINPDLTMSELAGEWAGRSVDEARKGMVGDLERMGLLRQRENYRHSVPHCDRCGTRIEPLISLQWFANMGELAERAITAVRDGEVRFIPKSSENIFYTWMEDLKPWCLSRQLWWGHQLPVWYCGGDDAHVHVSLDGPTEACADCGAADWRRDDDVLDTWFSSGLWTFATLGWPERTPDLAHFHPTAVLSTAREIINLWVARMMMFSYAFLDERPFADVYIHSVVQAPDGRRMSKSLGTGIDPLEMVEKYGADALRYGLLAMSSTQDVRFNEGKIKEGRDFANKLWNAVRLVRMGADADALAAVPGAVDAANAPTVTRLEDRWLLSRLAAVTAELDGLMARYDFALYVKTLYGFVWSEFCDWYLEAVKARFKSDDAAERTAASAVAGMAIDIILRLAHPVMPHVSEELREKTWPTSGWLLESTWPSAEAMAAWSDESADSEFASVRAAVGTLRSLRSAAGLAPAARITAALDADGGPLGESRDVIAALAGLEWGSPDDAIRVPVDGGAFALGGLDPAVLSARLAEALDEARGEVRRAEGKLSNAKFVERAPKELVDEQRGKLAANEGRIAELEAVLRQLGA